MPFSQERTPNTLRVLIIGDSYVWGQHVEPSERFAGVLGTYDPRLEVVTLALNGSNTPMQFDAWKEYGRDVNADIVILAISYDDNDMGFIPRPTDPEYLSSLIPASELAAQIDNRLRGLIPSRDLWQEWYMDIYAHGATREQWSASLHKFAEDIESHGAQAWALVLVQPWFDDESLVLKTSQDTEHLATEAGFATLNFIPQYRDYYGDLRNPPERWVTPGDRHYNKETHILIADTLWAALEPLMEEAVPTGTVFTAP